MKLIYLSILLSTSAHASKYEQFYLVGSRRVSAEEAILASMKGSEAFKCTAVEAKVSKAGTSIGMRQVKRPVKQ